jgi:hypothetical protein
MLHRNGQTDGLGPARGCHPLSRANSLLIRELSGNFKNLALGVHPFAETRNKELAALRTTPQEGRPPSVERQHAVAVACRGRPRRRPCSLWVRSCVCLAGWVARENKRPRLAEEKHRRNISLSLPMSRRFLWKRRPTPAATPSPSPLAGQAGQDDQRNLKRRTVPH